MAASLSIKINSQTVVANNCTFKFTKEMKSEFSDEQLILKYSKGELSAFEILYARHKGPLLRYCRRQFSSRAIAEECFQDIWLKVINNRSRYQPKALFTTYLYRIAQNHVIDIYRKEKKRSSDCEYEEEKVELALLHSSVENNQQQELQNEILQLRLQISKLPFEQRNTLILKLDAGLSLDEIAEVLECGKETVKSRLRYATNKLREQLTTPLGVKINER